MKCERCDGDGKAHGSDRPFESDCNGSYPGTCPACRGSGVDDIEWAQSLGDGELRAACYYGDAATITLLNKIHGEEKISAIEKGIYENIVGKIH